MPLPNLKELKKLSETATPGPWLVHMDEDGDPDLTYIHDESGRLCLSLSPIESGSEYKRSDLDLAALAPELLDEVIRLREEQGSTFVPNRGQWSITYGETTPYKWCVYSKGTPVARYISLSDALSYLSDLLGDHDA